MADSSGKGLRWVLLIDGEEVPEADVRIRERKGHKVICSPAAAMRSSWGGGVKVLAVARARQMRWCRLSVPYSVEARGIRKRQKNARTIRILSE